VETEPRAAFDLDDANRRGFDEDFAGVRVPLPELPRGAEPSVPEGAPDHVLRYEHFSVAMSRPRKLAYFVAVNIDGARTIDLGPRGRDRWIFDSRIPEDAQVGAWGYDDNDFDRGHLVRRLDPVWGDSEEEARKAEADTFHFTNSAPQHATFNRRRRFWQGIESYVLENADVHDLRLSVFTGPVLAEDDPVLFGAAIPLDYWKVVAMRKRDGSLSATAYLLSQEELVRTRGEFVFGPYKAFQVPVGEIERRTGLSFGNLREHDALRAARGLEAPRVELTRLEDMVV